MAIKFASRMNHLRASEIRELLKLTERPEVISFAGGLPAPEFFPVDEMRQVAERVLSTAGCRALQYATTEGYLPLRTKIAERMNRRQGTAVRPEEVLVTCGSQQGLDLTGKILLDEGDAVLCESPTYLGAINAFRAYGPRFVEVATDDEGMIIDDLERCLETTPRVKLLYVIPDFQNPSGRTWSEARRRAFLQVAVRHGVPVIEDSPYRDLRFEGEALPSLKSMDDHDLVVYLGTFSKIFCPGLRLGWLAAPAGLYDRYVMVKQGADLHTSSLSQMQLDAYLEMFDIDQNIDRIREVYRARRDTMLSTIAESFPASVRFTRPTGGLFVWAELPGDANARDVLAECIERDVAFVPGGAFFPNGGHENTMRLNYSNMPEARIAEGIRRMAVVLEETLAPAPSSAASGR